jgi:thiamine biosynthesis protein ThiI
MECLRLVLLLIRYNELGLKSPRVRSRFQKQLVKNIENKFLGAGQDCFIDSDWGRLYLHTDDAEVGIRLLTTVFGIFSISPVIKQSADLGEITDAAVEYAKSLMNRGQSFALRTRRTGTHEYTSQDVAVHVGEAIRTRLMELELSVNLTSPDVEIFIEVRRNNSYIFSESFQGPGGLPLGTQGKVLSIFSDEQSYIAAWLMMKRGCRVYPVYIRSAAEVAGDNKKGNEERFKSQLELLKGWVPDLQLKVIHAQTYTTDEDLDNLGKQELFNFSRRVRAKGICVSWDFKRFSKHPSKDGTGLPIFYPLIGLDKKQLAELATKIKEGPIIAK